VLDPLLYRKRGQRRMKRTEVTYKTKNGKNTFLKSRDIANISKATDKGKQVKKVRNLKGI